VTALLLTFCALLGLAVGSFLNVVVWRVPRGESVVSPPSACPRCQQPIRPRDNVPVLGWLLLRGACRDCSEPISFRYPMVEAATAALFVIMGLRFGPDPVLPAFLYLAAVGLALALIDVDVKRLPDVLTLPSYGVAAVLLSTAALVGGHGDQLLRAGLGALVAFGFYFTVWFVYPAGMGFGDVKLSGVLGAYLGWVSWAAVTAGLFLGFLYGGVFGIGVVLLTEGGRKTKVPFGPFMLLGALTGILVGQQLIDGYLALTLG
jgi:leader peptidase (prepilin peptidase)/N-methyltransferase